MQAKTAGHMERVARGNGRKVQSTQIKAAQWARIMEAQGESDLTVVEFCRRRGIAKATFWYWRKRLATTGKHELVANPAQRFLAVPIVAPIAERIEVDLGTMRVRLDGAGAARLVDVIVARVQAGTRE